MGYKVYNTRKEHFDVMFKFNSLYQKGETWSLPQGIFCCNHLTNSSRFMTVVLPVPGLIDIDFV